MPDSYVRITLLTAAGGLVTTAYLPPYVSMPEVVIWGDRVFKVNPRLDRNYLARREYIEVFAYVLTHNMVDIPVDPKRSTS